VEAAPIRLAQRVSTRRREVMNVSGKKGLGNNAGY
jgi:hypothetical protein